jgi:acetate kinase
MIVLCLDAGSSSLKFGLYRAEGLNDALQCVTSGTLDGALGDSRGLLDRLLKQFDARPDAVGHRVVFGGPNRFDPTIADETVLRELEGVSALEPLHLRAELDLVYAARAALPGIPQVLCFDTAFFQPMPAIAKRFPLPPIDPALRRYGFHGLSYEYVTSALGPALAGRAIVAHLGSGASLCALRNGTPVDTTMGFSALGGLMMATRPGDLDPGAVLQLLSLGYDDRAKLSDIFFRRSGLAGVSGTSGDIRTLIAAAPGDERARDAIELFDYQLLKLTGAMIAVLGGLDTLVFTGGIGEHQPPVRLNLCRSLEHVGIRIDEQANARNAATISSEQSAVTVRVFPTDENLAIARHTLALLQPTKGD